MSEANRIAEVIESVLAPGHFYVANGLELVSSRNEAEELTWEIFRGRLLDPAHTRAHRKFQSWKIHLIENGQRSSEPLVSLKWDRDAGEIHVVRGLLCYVWEAYDNGGNVILSRETSKWVRELVSTLKLTRLPEGVLREELAGRVFQAFVGASRLPLNSVEAPLPGFSLGRLACFPWAGASAAPMRSIPEIVEGWLNAGLTTSTSAKLLEFLLRAAQPEQVADAARIFTGGWKATDRPSSDMLALFRTMFNEVSLSPYTKFVDNALAFLHALVEQGQITLDQRIDVLSQLLRQIARHLTAYDLITFHHRGANYPDALLLDALLKDYVALIERKAELFSGQNAAARLRRRALRQGCLLRRFYEGHLVPDAPTSPGENARVLPGPHVRVPEEQLLQPLKRRKQLYDGAPTLGLLGPYSRMVLKESLQDLSHPDELRELGTALFIDRPLGMGKAPGEPDHTPLLSHEAFSRSIVERRLRELVHFDSELPLDEPRARLRTLAITGFPASDVATPGRPVVSLADARRVAEDFVFVRTMPGSVRQFFGSIDLNRVPARVRENIKSRSRVLIVTPAAQPGIIAIYDGSLQRILELQSDLSCGFESIGEVENQPDPPRI